VAEGLNQHELTIDSIPTTAHHSSAMLSGRMQPPGSVSTPTVDGASRPPRYSHRKSSVQPRVNSRLSMEPVVKEDLDESLFHAINN